MEIFRSAISGILYSVYPNKCLCCDRAIGRNENICKACAENIEKFEYHKRCKACGLIKERCRCKRHIYHFSGLIAPFYNYGIAKTGFYKYKLGSRERFADFFASAMIKSLKIEFADIDFDIVCCVPPSAIRMRKYGYNPPEQLAEKISQGIGIEFVKDALGCKKSKISQHELGYKKRFEAVKGCYFPQISLKNKTVLLVDDISTTGATLDECAYQLLKSGANEVWCVCALITDKDFKAENEYTTEILRRQGFVVEK